MPIAAFGRHRHGHAIYDIPEAPFHAGFAGPLDTEETDTIVARYFERTLSLVETEENSLEFLSDDETILVQLESEPDFEINDVILCQVTDTVAGIVDACYMLALTENMSTNYIALTPAFVLTAPVWSDTEINQITLWDNDLYETGVGTRIFTNITYTLAVLDGAPQTPDVDVWRISFTDGWYGENAVFVVEETGPTTLVFRNCDPPIPTDRPPSEPEDHVSWRIKIEGMELEQLESVTIESPLEQVIVDEFISGSILTEAEFVLVPPGTTAEQVPESEYMLLRIDPAQLGARPKTGQMVIASLNIAPGGMPSQQIEPAAKKHPARSAQVMRSFSWWENVSLAPAVDRGSGENITDQVKQLGYSVLPHNSASKEWVLNNMVEKDVIVWYTHGNWKGVRFSENSAVIDDDNPEWRLQLRNETLIERSDLPDNLDIRFALMTACASAWTGLETRQAARLRPYVHQSVIEFASKLGPDIAYVGFSWIERPGPGYQAAVDLLKLLKGGNTVREALRKYDDDIGPAGRFKGWGPGLDYPVNIEYLGEEGWK